MTSANHHYTYSNSIGFAFLLSTLLIVSGALGYLACKDYFSPKRPDSTTIQTKLDDIESRLDQLRAGRNTNAIIRVMTEEEKNALWWRIARTANRSGSDPIRYNLTHAQASRVAEEFGLSVPNIFEFFRENASAPWRTNRPPGEKEEQRTLR